MTRSPRATQLAELARAIALFQSATYLVDEAVAVRLGVNRTDLRCLGFLYDSGPLHAGRLSAAAALSPGATTAAIDRLERAGYVRRVRAGEDRRAVLVELTPVATARIEELYGPVGRAGIASLAHYSDEELRFLRAFLDNGYRLQVEQAARIRAPSDAIEPPDGPPEG